MRKKRVTLTLVLTVMVMIFCFSSLPGAESAEQSGRIVALVTAVLNRLGIDGIKALESGILSFTIRKLGHLSEFALLGLTLQLHFGYGRGWVVMNTLSTAGGPPSHQGEGFSGQGSRRWKCFFWSLVIGALYACSDEFHQRFVPGRGPAVRDVCIDSVGVLIGIGVMCLILRWVRRKRARGAVGSAPATGE